MLDKCIKWRTIAVRHVRQIIHSTVALFITRLAPSVFVPLFRKSAFRVVLNYLNGLKYTH